VAFFVKNKAKEVIEKANGKIEIRKGGEGSWFLPESMGYPPREAPLGMLRFI